jgi:hypothetical protein
MEILSAHVKVGSDEFTANTRHFERLVAELRDHLAVARAWPLSGRPTRVSQAPEA